MSMLIDALNAGLVFWSDDTDEGQPVDVVVQGETSVFVGYAGWWRADWANHEGFEVIGGKLLEPVGKDSVWRFEGTDRAYLDEASTSEMQMRIARTRRLADIYRGEYLNAISRMSDELGSAFDFSEWAQVIMDREPYDPVSAYRKKALGLRKTCGLFLINGDNVNQDVLVIDEHGNAAVARDNSWLTSFANRWTEMNDRPKPESFIEWLATQRPYGPYRLSNPFTMEAEGSIDDLAAKSLVTGVESV